MVENVSYVDRLDAADEQERVQLARTWLRTDWRPFFAELRARRPVLRTAAFTLVTRFADVIEVLSRERVFTVRPYQPRMDPVVGPFMLARDATPVNWREKGVMQAMLRPEDLPVVRSLAGAIADEFPFAGGRLCAHGKAQARSVPA